MNPYRLQRIIGRLERQRAELIQRIEAWPRAWLSYRPAPAAWSALEVLDHLRKTELAVMQSCEKNLKSRKNTVTRAERAKAVVFLAMMRLPIKVKVPEAVSFVRPDPVTSIEGVLASWNAGALQLTAFVEALSAGTEDIGLVFHPAIGWMDIRAALTFLEVHLRHHQFQLDRIRKVCEQRGAQIGAKLLSASKSFHDGHDTLNRKPLLLGGALLKHALLIKPAGSHASETRRRRLIRHSLLHRVPSSRQCFALL